MRGAPNKSFDLFAKPENFNEMPFSAGSVPTQALALSQDW